MQNIENKYMYSFIPRSIPAYLYSFSIHLHANSGIKCRRPRNGQLKENMYRHCMVLHCCQTLHLSYECNHVEMFAKQSKPTCHTHVLSLLYTCDYIL